MCLVEMNYCENGLIPSKPAALNFSKSGQSKSRRSKLKSRSNYYQILKYFVISC